MKQLDFCVKCDCRFRTNRQKRVFNVIHSVFVWQSIRYADLDVVMFSLSLGFSFNFSLLIFADFSFRFGFSPASFSFSPKYNH